MMRNHRWVGLVCVAIMGSASWASIPSGTPKVLNIAQNSGVKGMDPMNLNDLYSGTVIAQIFEPLFQYHYLKRPFELEPCMAEKLPEISKDRLTYRVRIKKGIRFHDDPAFPGGKGREVTAQDFVYSIKRLADPRSQSEAYFSIENRLKGLTEWGAGLASGKTNYDTEVEGLRAIDSHTIEFKLMKVYPQLTQVLAIPSMAAVAREVVEKYGADIASHPIGTGPFRLDPDNGWVRGSRIRLKKNPNYRTTTYPKSGDPGDAARGLLADAGKNLPMVDEVVIHEMPEDQPRWLNGLSGKLQYFDVPSDSMGAAVDEKGSLLPELASKGLKLTVVDDLGLTYVAFNLKDPVLGQNKRLRQAMSLAFDSKTFIDMFHPRRAKPAQGPVPPGIDTYDPKFKNPWRVYNVDHAKKLLAEAGFPEGKGLPEFTYEAMADSKSRQMAEFFQRSMAAIGIKIKYNPNTWPELLKKIKESRAQMVSLGWGGVYPDPQAFFMALSTENLPPGPNVSNFSNKKYDELYEVATRLEPGAKRTKIYHQMRDLLVDETPWIFNAHRQRYLLSQPNLRNFKPLEVGLNTMKYLDLR